MKIPRSLPRSADQLHRFTLFLIFLAIVHGSAWTQAAETDYLSPELRDKVEALKNAYHQAPTRPTTYNERAAILWEWANAYAMTGKSIPVEMTTMIRPNRPIRPTVAQSRGLDFYLEELTLLDEEPDALGELSADLGPFEARSFVSFKQRYTVGSKPIKTGGGFLVARHFMPGYGRYQTADPQGDNYVTITSSNTGVSFKEDSIPLRGMHGGFRGAQPALFFKVDNGILNTGDVVTVTYGDRSEGSRGILMGSASTDFLPVPIYVDFDGSGHTFALPIQPISVTGSEVAGVHAFAPSIVRPGEDFDLSVRAQDRFYNRAEGAKPGFIVFANGEALSAIAPSNQAITVLKNLRFRKPGVYRIAIQSEDGIINGVGNPILVSDTVRKIYWGDTHGHSGFAEGIGSPDRFMEWAKEDARLDFVTHSEHDIWMDDYEWKQLTENVEKYSESGRFIGYLGYEWTTQNRFGGHHNVLFRDTKNRKRIPTQYYPQLSLLYQGLRTHHDPHDVLVIPHAHQAGDYRQSDPLLENLVEIMSKHGTFEWFGRMYLQHGHQVGFIAASDDHLSQPGYTAPSGNYHSQRGGLAAVLAEENTRDGIFDAMKNLQTYATSGDRIILDFSINGEPMGNRIPFSDTRKLRGRVIGTGPIDSITIFRNDKEIWFKDYLTVEDKRYHNEETFYVSFYSDSIPMHPQDNPRGTRGWGGELRVIGADIVGFDSTDFLHPEVSLLEAHPTKANTLNFRTGTRGDSSSIILDLKDIQPNARITLKLDPTREQGSPPRFRPHARIQGTSVELAFANLERGQTTKVIPLDVYRDEVSLRRVITDGDSDIRFEFTDQSRIQGDYYYVRIKQANDAMAWSSPIWVGGIRPR